MDCKELLEISCSTLKTLGELGCESGKNCENIKVPLIFPTKREKKVRISEQELRLLFIEKWKEKNDEKNNDNKKYYSIETPTKYIYSLKKTDEGQSDKDQFQSASIDMSIFKCDNKKFKRELNIEFKHNHEKKSIEKDILKLLCEDQDGVFIVLLNNTTNNTTKKTLSSVYGKIFNFLDYKNIENARVKLVNEDQISCEIAEPKDIKSHLNKDKKIHIVVMSLQSSKSRNCESSKDLYLIYHQINFSENSKQNLGWYLEKNIEEVYDDCVKQNSICCENKLNECECYKVKIESKKEEIPFIIEHCCVCKVT